MSLDDAVLERLGNFKFDQAKQLVDAEPGESTERERETIDALASMFGNVGWIFGDMGAVLSAALRDLGVTE